MIKRLIKENSLINGVKERVVYANKMVAFFENISNSYALKIEAQLAYWKEYKEYLDNWLGNRKFESITNDSRLLDAGGKRDAAIFLKNHFEIDRWGGDIKTESKKENKVKTELKKILESVTMGNLHTGMELLSDEGHRCKVIDVTDYYPAVQKYDMERDGYFYWKNYGNANGFTFVAFRDLYTGDYKVYRCKENSTILRNE
jgi:hypothetical protein